MSNSQPNHHDAELVLKLYDLRRESVMREARNWMATFNPQSIDDVHGGHGATSAAKENAYLRQVCSYWEMVASLIVHGTLNADLAYDTLGEMYFVYAIVQPVLEDFRKKFNSPNSSRTWRRWSRGRRRAASASLGAAAPREMMSRMAAAAAKSGD